MKKIFFRHGVLLTLILMCKSVHAQQILLTNLISPAPIEQAGGSVNINLEFLNNSGSNLTSADFYYSVNGGSPNLFPWTGNLGAGSSDTIIFPAFIIPNGQYSLCFWTLSPASDTICYTYVGSNSIITPPFGDDFEAASDWASSLSIPNYLSGWQVGTPNYGEVNTPHSGANSWVIGLDSGYENGMLSYLYSPYFNFSNGNSWKISFWQNRNTEPTRDGAWLEYSSDSGITWSVLGTFNDPNATNWYMDSLYQGNHLQAWDSASNGWRLSIYNWQLGSLPLVQLRFGFYSDAAGTWDGIAIDDFSIDSCDLSLSIASLQNVSCNGANDGEICVNVTGGTSPYMYSWSDGTTAQCTQNLSPGVYSIVVMDAHACSASIGATISEPAQLIIDSISTVSASCATSNGSACVYVSGGTTPYSYIWSNANTTQCISGLPAGAYTLTVTDLNGCTNTSQSFVNGSSSIFIALDSVYNVSCGGGTNGSIYVTITGGTLPITYFWSNGATTQDLTNLGAGTYTITVTDANNCTGFWSYTLTQPPQLILTNPSSITICPGTGLCAVPAGGTPPFNYQWSTTETTQCLTSPSGGTYTVTITDANNCSVSGTINLTVDPPIQIFLSGDLYICSGDSASVTATVTGGTVPYNYLWSDGSSFGILYTMVPGTYTITVTDIAGCSVQDSINIHCDGVWPGDANYDGTANNLDLLPIGIGYGTTGPVRPGASLVWIAQPSPAWADTLSGTINYKHIDCNGDGIINDADTAAIIQNYGQTHPLRLLPTPQNLLDPYLYFDIALDSAGTNQQIDVPLMFGTSAVPADSIYGLAFTVNYDTTLVIADSVGIDFGTCWIGTTGTDLITLQHNDPLNGKLYVGMTRINHSNTSGFGEIAKVTVVTVDNVSGKIASASVFDTLTFILSDVTVIDKDEIIRNVNLGNDTLIVEDSTTSIHEILLPEEVKVYPNPAKNKLYVEIPYEYSINEISITNLVGEKAFAEMNSKNNRIEIKNLDIFSNGIYFISIKTGGGKIVKKFCVLH